MGRACIAACGVNASHILPWGKRQNVFFDVDAQERPEQHRNEEKTVNDVVMMRKNKMKSIMNYFFTGKSIIFSTPPALKPQCKTQIESVFSG